MELKTKVTAEEGKQDIHITREFDLPVELLFKAHTEPKFLEQWMGTKVEKFEGRPHGSYRFVTSDDAGKVMFSANGVFHEIIPNQKITRTFEMENAPFGVQLEFMEFEKLTENTSKLQIHSIFRSAALRDQQLQMPFKQGINMAHNRLEEVLGKMK